MPGNPLTDQNWAADLTDQITGLVGKVRDNTTHRAVKAARGLVFGVIAAILGIVTVVVGLIGATRGIQALLDRATSWDRAVYISYFAVGGVLTLAGLVLLGKSRSNS